MQALILAGGEGTRLRPLTSTIPKPVVPLVNRPFIAYMLEWLRGHGVDDAILSCGFMAEGVRNVLGDGESLGMRIRYLEEPTPLGTGGALKFAEDWLDKRFLMLNGDVLTDIDVSAQIHQHERTGARATLALIGVDDPSAYGLVRLENDHSVREFLEKPGPDQVDNTNLVNAGVYVLEREVLDGMPPAGTKTSIEREVFPTLVGHGLYGYRASGYWLDIGTPARYLQATYDILEERVHTLVGDDLRAAHMALTNGAEVRGEIVPPVIAGAGTRVSAQATVGARTVLGAGVSVAARAQIVDSVLLDGASVGDGSVVRGSIIGSGVTIGENCDIEEVVLGEGVRIGSDNVLRHGARIFPGVELTSGAIKF